MISFLNEEIRTAFHLLPIETQQEYNDLAMKFAQSNQQLVVEEVHLDGKVSEVSIRIDRQSNRVGPFELKNP